MRDGIKIFTSLFFGFLMGQIGYPFYTWQFWLFAFVFGAVYCLIEEKFFPEKINKDE